MTTLTMQGGVQELCVPMHAEKSLKYMLFLVYKCPDLVRDVMRNQASAFYLFDERQLHMPMYMRAHNLYGVITKLYNVYI